MKSRSLLIPTILAATAAFGVSSNAFSEPRDAQAQAAALLSGPHTSEVSQTHERGYAPSSSTAVDAQASAAALLAGRSTDGLTKISAASTPTVARKRVDANAHAAALLSGERIAAATKPTGDHPAVIVARQWSTRGIDPNQFIVGHPAGLRLIGTPPSGESEALVRVDTAVTIF
jgi:hypothetical protein